MKTLNLKSFALIVSTLICLTLFSCKKDEVPTDTNNNTTVTIPASSLTSYTGALNYTSTTGQVVNEPNATATIEKNGSTYSISFSDNVPTISSLEFKDEDGEYASLSSSNSMSGIVIDGDDLDIGATNNGNTWAFSGSK